MTQPALFSVQASSPSPSEVEHLIACLKGKGWTSAGVFNDFWSDRKVRAMAAASQGQVISGQRGYRLTCEATVEEANHAANWMSHQGHAMIRRSIEIRKAIHVAMRKVG